MYQKIAIEVKSNSAKNTAGLDIFRSMFNPSKAFIVGDGGMSLKDFFSLDINKIFT